MYLEVSGQGGIETWCIARPDRANGLGTTIAKDLSAQCRRLSKQLGEEASQGPAALILSAKPAGRADQPVWVAGGDLRELQEIKSPQEAKSYAETMVEVCQTLVSLPIPVVALIHGRAIGGGAELALAADLRIGTTAATFEFRQLAMGLSMGYGTAGLLVSLVGLAKAQELLYLKKSLNADACQSLGLLHEVCSDAESLTQRGLELAEALGKQAPEAFSAQKRLFHLSRKNMLAQEETEIFCGIWGNPSHRRALDEFLKKKSP